MTVPVRLRLGLDTLTGAVLFVACLVFGFVIVPDQTLNRADAVFPELATTVLGALSLALFFQGLLRARPASDAASSRQGTERVWPRVVLVLAWFTAYVVAMSHLGFYVASLIYVPVCMLLIARGRLLSIAVTPVVLVGAIYLLMEVVLTSPLPSSRLF